MVTSHDPNDLGHPRTRRHLPRFQAVPPPEPDLPGGWDGWATLLADDDYDPEVGVGETLNVPPRGGFGTVCASLLALSVDGSVRWEFAAGRPGHAPFQSVSLRA
jgi:hypothetical protein